MRSKIHSAIVFRSILDKNQLIEVIQSLNKVIMYPCFSDEKELKLNFEVMQENISLLISQRILYPYFENKNSFRNDIMLRNT